MCRFIALFALLLPAAAQAQDQLFEINDDVSLSVGAGYSFIKGDEIVYDGDDRISHLIWESKSPTVTGGLDVEFASGWTLRAGGAVAVRGDSHMEDYDWLEPFRTSFDFEDWTHQSVHPDTRLHHYFTGDLAVGKDIRLGAATLNLHGGIKYTSVHWTAYGGTYTYSVAGFRDQSGGFPDGERGISFQQRYPGVFLGADPLAAGAPEGCHFRVLQLQRRNPFEKFDILSVAPRPAAFNIMNAEFIQFYGNFQFVLHR